MRQHQCIFLLATVSMAIASLPSKAVDGGYDATWQSGGRELIPIASGFDARLRDMLVQPDGKLVVAGDCDVSQGEYDCMARLLPNGVLDLSFGPYGTGRFTFEDYTAHYPPFGTLGRHGLLRQPDGRLVLAGYGEFNGAQGSEYDGTLARLSADGQLEVNGTSTYTPIDFSYNTSHPGNWIEAAALQSDGKIIVAGATNRPNSNPVNRDCAVARLNADRTLDFAFGGGNNGAKLVAFDQGGANDDYCEDIAVQADGKIVVVGYAEIVVNATSVKDVAVARLNSDGTYDNTFGNAGRLWFSAYDGVRDTIGYAVKIDRQGGILIAGLAQFAGADSDFFIARLLPTGTLDNAFSGNGIRIIAFDLALPKHDLANDLALQSDGKILVAGSASRSSTADAFAILRLNANGTLDSSFGSAGTSHGSFSPGTAFEDIGTSIALGPGGIFVAGQGDSGAGTGLTDFGIARLTLDLIFADGFQ
ncbi:MAG: hypothetical protein ABIQ70_03250 [Dokdonella sp.]